MDLSAIEWMGTTLSVLGLIVAVGIAYGRLKQVVADHTRILEASSMNEIMTPDKCEKKQHSCSQSMLDTVKHLTGKMDGLQTEVKEIKVDLKANEEKLNRYQQQTAGTLGRIEGTLNLLVQRLGGGG
ncbi:MAG: hypothetical protein JRI80_04835 [Deltaproteobacteria bacterium]|nr:hypothetical protein [Deltaproteobacteria bacterium]